MARHRKRGGHRSSGLMGDARKVVKQIGGFGSSLLIAGPVIIPIAKGLLAVKAGRGVQGFYSDALWDGIGYSVTGNQMNTGQATIVATRDVAMIIGGIILKKALKRV